MAGRPRRYSDDNVARATLTVISSKGVHALKLADVAELVGATAASLLHRFGTKRLLLLHTSQWCVRDLASRVQAFLSRSKPSIQELLETVLLVDDDVTSMRHHAEFLVLDLKDPDFERNATQVIDLHRIAIRHLLRSHNVTITEDVVLAAYHGAILVSMIEGQRSTSAIVHSTLEKLIGEQVHE